MSIELTALIGALGTIVGAAVGVAGARRSAQKEAQAEGKSDGVLLTEVGYVKSGIDDIKREQREQTKTNIEVLTRLTAVEASAKQAHKRLDEIDNSH